MCIGISFDFHRIVGRSVADFSKTSEKLELKEGDPRSTKIRVPRLTRKLTRYPSYNILEALPCH